MRLKASARNPQKRKAYVQQPGLWLVGVDVRQAKQHACIGTQTGITCRKLALTPSREGFRLFAQTLRNPLVKNSCRHLLSAMEPSGLSWQGLYDRLRSCGYDVCLVSGQAVRHNRQTRQEATRKTDAKDAYSVLDWRRPGQCFLPVARDAALQAASRLLHRSRALNKRRSPLRHQLRAAIPLTFPAFNPLIQALTQPTA